MCGLEMRATDVPPQDGLASVVCVRRRYVMQAMFASIVGQVAEMGVFFVAAAALTAGALALR